ncbi:uncharacterized protein LOC143078603 [Mytilus galloprovincialis]|uniref:uncharacterized protein LOC143078603 n=1 Tax=Mytilus galloprovincialis TaxID=29158 RepID=UPI003F7B5E27
MITYKVLIIMIHVIHYISKYPGMIHSGIGGTQLSNFLSVLNIHSIDFKALKERENETGAAIEAQAEISEERYLQEEINQSFTEENGDTQTGISVSTDTCWQKKGSGRSYNSLSGINGLTSNILLVQILINYYY